MSALSYEIKSGVACTSQPDTGYYYGYFHQRTGGPGLQRSVTHYLGTGQAAVADGSDNLLSYANIAFEKASRAQRALIAAIAVVKLCTSENHSGEPYATTTGPRVERVVMAGIVKPGGKRIDY